MGTLTDTAIRNWIKSGERFEGRGDGEGLWLSFRETFAVPIWRYRFAGKARVMNLGSYGDLFLADARKTAKEMWARVALGHDVAGEPEMVLADAGYPSEDTLRTLKAQGQPACVALGREGKQHRAIDPLCYPATAQMAQRLQSPEGKAHYRRRKTIPEPVFGWIKQALGFRRFSLRGLEAAKAEWNLVCMAVNLKRMHTLGWRAA